MNTWTTDELAKINGADELQIEVLKKDGTLRRPVTIWVVRVNSDLYIRSVKGSEGKWFQHVAEMHEGRIEAAGLRKEVIFSQVGEDNAAEIDTAYLTKYSGYGESIVGSTVTEKARAATLKVSPK